MNRFYLDYAASTPVSPGVMRAMKPYFSHRFGNPGSLHSYGQEAMAVVDRSRETIATALGVQFREIVFTGSATEANNLALRGALGSAHGTRRLLVSAVEHESVLETARFIAASGVEVITIPVDRQGIVQVQAVERALAGRAALVSIMCANNETGARQPIPEIARVVHAAGGLLHTDATQAFQFTDCSPAGLGADLLTLSGHKIYGPKGVGVLYVRSGVTLAPIVTGGGQEYGWRSGTENVPLIAGFAAAVSEIGKDKEKHARRIAALKERTYAGIKKMFPRAQANGPAPGSARVLPHILNVRLPGMQAEEILIRLDLAGVAVSAGSACTARSSRVSHVLQAMGMSDGRARESIRVSFGRPTTTAEVAHFLKVLRSW